MQESQFTSSNGTSVLRYTPRTDLDYGTLLCSADNAVGIQAEACSFRVVPAGRPDPPVNCSASNQSYSTVTVACTAGADGGIEQRFQVRTNKFFAPFWMEDRNFSAPFFGLWGSQKPLNYQAHMPLKSKLDRIDQNFGNFAQILPNAS